MFMSEMSHNKYIISRLSNHIARPVGRPSKYGSQDRRDLIMALWFAGLAKQQLQLQLQHQQSASKRAEKVLIGYGWKGLVREGGIPLRFELRLHYGGARVSYYHSILV